MSDLRTDTERGWQNVLREIRRMLNLTRRLPDEPPLHPVEEAEHAAWQTAHDAVLARLAGMDGDSSLLDVLPPFARKNRGNE
jgi:hypothetical protein